MASTFARCSNGSHTSSRNASIRRDARSKSSAVVCSSQITSVQRCFARAIRTEEVLDRVVDDLSARRFLPHTASRSRGSGRDEFLAAFANFVKSAVRYLLRSDDKQANKRVRFVPAESSRCFRLHESHERCRRAFPSPSRACDPHAQRQQRVPVSQLRSASDEKLQHAFAVLLPVNARARRSVVPRPSTTEIGRSQAASFNAFRIFCSLSSRLFSS